jgi:hypothetical protein
MAEATPEDYYETFHRAGAPRRVLDDLLAEFYHRPSFAPGQPESSAVFYEGERSVILYILRKCEAGRPGMTVASQAEPLEVYDIFSESEQVDVFAEPPEDDGSMV